MSYIKFLQAGQGESILIHLDAPVFNILVDGGISGKNSGRKCYRN